MKDLIPEKLTTFGRSSVDWLFSHESMARIHRFMEIIINLQIFNNPPPPFALEKAVLKVNISKNSSIFRKGLWGPGEQSPPPPRFLPLIMIMTLHIWSNCVYIHAISICLPTKGFHKYQLILIDWILLAHYITVNRLGIDSDWPIVQQ
jgi:hypothetical protein